MGNIINNVKCNCFDNNQEDETELNPFENSNKKINKKTILIKAQENKEKID